MQVVTTPVTTTAPVANNADTSATPQAPQTAAPAVRLTGAMLRTLSYLASQSAPVTHNTIAAATGHHKGNKLRELLAAGYSATTLAPGTRGYVYAATPAGIAALNAARATGAAIPALVQPAVVVPALPPVPQADLGAFFAAPVVPVVEPVATEPSAPTAAPSKGKGKPAKPRKAK